MFCVGTSQKMTSLLHYCDPTAIALLRERRSTAKLLSQASTTNKLRGYVRNAISALTNTGGLASILLVFIVFLLFWRAAGLAANCDNPLVVVLSGSMEPAYYRNDLLVLHNNSKPAVSDVIVFNLPGRTVPIVHRVHRVHEDGDTRLLLTKGDNNELDDRVLYPVGFTWVKEEDIVGKVCAIIPHVGFLTNLSEDRPWVKYALVGAAVLWAWLSGM